MREVQMMVRSFLTWLRSEWRQLVVRQRHGKLGELIGQWFWSGLTLLVYAVLCAAFSAVMAVLEGRLSHSTMLLFHLLGVFFLVYGVIRLLKIFLRIWSIDD